MEGSERIVSSGVLSEYLSIGERRIQQLTSQDILKKQVKPISTKRECKPLYRIFTRQSRRKK